MENSTESKENITHGCLKFNDKIYPVYEGHNTIGRNPDAIINIKNLTVSKHHAVITILDNGTHYISDLKSSSGTILNEKKLTPLLLYKLDNGASIKFGNVHCTYKKLEIGNSFRKSIEDTQQFSESFYVQQTQEVETSNLPDGINFNELPTQIFSSKDLNIHEMPTQLHEFSNIANDSSNDSIDFMTMQKSTETQALQSTNIQQASNETNSVETEKSLSQICPVVLSARKIVDSETDDDLTPSSQLLTVKSSKKQNVIDSDSSDTEDYIIDKVIKTKYHISDDSETEVEDDNLPNRTCKEIEVPEEKNAEEETQSLITEDISNSPILNKGTPKMNKERIPQDHLYCQSFSHSQIEFEKNEEKLDEKKKVEEQENQDLLKIDENKVSSPNPNDIFEEPIQELDIYKKQPQENVHNELTIKDIFLQPTQTLNIFEEDSVSEKESKTSADKNIYLLSTQADNVQTNNKDEIYLLPTQTMEMIPEEKSQEKEITNKNQEENSSQITKNSELFPTQALEILHGVYQPDQNQSILNDNKSLNSSTEKEDVFVSGTQDLEQLLSDETPSTSNKKDVFLAPEPFLGPSPIRRSTPRKKPLALLSAKDDDVDDDDDDILQPTQALEIIHKDTTPFNKVENQLQEIFASQSLLCTQQLVDVLNTSCDEVIEDSMLQQRRSVNLKNSEPLSDEVVINILAEDVDVEVEKKPKDKKNDESVEQNMKNNLKLDRNEELNQKKANTRKTRSRINESLVDPNKATTEANNEKQEISTKENKSKTNKNVKSKMEETKQAQELVTTSRRRGRKQTEDEEIKNSEEQVKSSSTTTRKLRRNLVAFDKPNSEESKNDSCEKSDEITTKRKRAEKDKESSVETSKSESQGSERTTRSTKNKENREDTQVQEKNVQNKKTDSQNSESNTIVKRRGRSKKQDSKIETNEKMDNTENEDLKKTNKSNDKKEESSIRKSTRNKNKITESDSDSKTDKSKELDSQPNKKTNKRKKNTEDETPETPTKKKAIENKITSPQKRVIKLPTSDSEDEFETSPPTVPKLDDSLTKTRKSPRKLKSDESSDETAISFAKNEIATSTPFVEPNAKQRRLSANSRRQKREEEEKLNTTTTRKGELDSSVLTTPERSRRNLKPRVVFTMMDNPELESLIRQLGGTVVDNVDICTVLVTENVKRSQKLLCAVGQGKPICSPKWLLACKKSFTFVDPWDHLLVDQEAEKKWKFSLRESLNRSTKEKLLKDYTFQLIVNNAADVLKGAIESCGGKCVTRSLPKSDSKHLVIVSTRNNKSKYSKIVKQNPEIKVVEPEAIFDGTLRQQFKFDNFLLT